MVDVSYKPTTVPLRRETTYDGLRRILTYDDPSADGLLARALTYSDPMVLQAFKLANLGYTLSEAAEAMSTRPADINLGLDVFYAKTLADLRNKVRAEALG